jgi:hypothetical protein
MVYANSCKNIKKQKDCRENSSCVWLNNNCVPKVNSRDFNANQSVYNPNPRQFKTQERDLITDDPRIRGKKPGSD